MSEDLVIDLTKLDSTEPLKAESLIFRKTHDDIVASIEQLLKVNLPYIEQRAEEKHGGTKRNAVFFINGSRGSGKSTLLRTVKNTLVRERPELRISPFADIDPSCMAPGENFFIHLLSIVCKKIDASIPSDKCFENGKKAMRLIQEMSDGLKLLVSSGDAGGSFADSASFIEDCMERCTSAADLHDKFAELVENLCAIYKVNAFLITVDDIDTRFDKGFEILEYYRIYLNTPRIIFLVAGDIKQYSMVIRAHLLEQFGHASLQFDYAMEKQRNSLLYTLCEQYLLKLIPADNIFNVARRFDFMELLERNVEVKYRDYEEDAKEVNSKRSLAVVLFNNFDCLTSLYYRSVFKDFFETMPIRSILQMLRIWSKGLKKEKEKSITREYCSVIADGIMSVGLSILNQKDINCVDIRKGDFCSLLQSIISHVAEGGNIDEASKLLPDRGDYEQRFVSFYLTAEVVSNFFILKRKLLYLCFVLPQLEMLSSYLYRIKREQREISLDELKEYGLNSCRRINNYNSGQGGACATTCIVEALKNQQLLSGKGVVCLPNKPFSQEKNSSSLFIVDFFDALISHMEEYIKSEDDLLACLALYFSIGRVEVAGTIHYCFSMYNLLTISVQLLSYTREATPIGSFDDEYYVEMINDFARYNNANKYFPSPKSLYMEHDAQKEGMDESFEQFFGSETVKKYMPVATKRLFVWGVDYKKSEWKTSPVEFWNCWRAYMRRSTHVMNAVNEGGKHSSAYDLYVDFMEKFESSVESFIDSKTNKLSTPIKTFPLWAALKKLKTSDSNLANLLKELKCQ